MHKVVVAAATSVRTFGSTNLNLAVALRHSVGRAGLADTDHLRLVLIVGLAERVKHLNRVILNHAVEHILDFIGGRTLVSDDEGVEAALVEELQPRHVKLRGGRAAPLSSLEQNKTYRFFGEPPALKHRHQYSLRIPKFEQHVLSAALLLDAHEERRPKREVVLASQTDELLRYFGSILFIRFNVQDIGKEFGDRTCFEQLLYKRHVHHWRR